MYYGIHVSSAGGIENTIKSAQKYGVNAIQIMPTIPMRWAIKLLPEEMIQALENKVDKINGRVTELEATQPFLKEMVQQNTAAYQKLTETMIDVRIAMTQINDNLSQQSDDIVALENKVEEVSSTTDAHFDSVSKRIKQIEDNEGKTIVSEGLAANYSDIINYAVSKW